MALFLLLKSGEGETVARMFFICILLFSAVVYGHKPRVFQLSADIMASVADQVESFFKLFKMISKGLLGA